MRIRAERFPMDRPETLVAYGRDLALPGEFRAFVEGGATFPYDLTVDMVVEGGRPVCKAVRFEQQADGPPVSSEQLRKVPLAGVIRDVVSFVAFRVEREPGGEIVYCGWPATDTELSGSARVERPRRRITDDLLKEVAAIYRAAQSSPGRAAPTEAVKRHYRIARPTAGRWVQQARARGFLPSAEERKGER